MTFLDTVVWQQDLGKGVDDLITHLNKLAAEVTATASRVRFSAEWPFGRYLAKQVGDTQQEVSVSALAK